MQTFTANDGLEIAFQDEGEGLPVLALSGLTRNSDDFNFVAPHLKGIRLIRMDYRGRGRSDWGNHTTYTVPQEGLDALSLMSHLGIDKTAILGTSRGGLIAMGLAATVKDKLLGVCMNDIGPELAQHGLDNIMGYLGRKPAAKTIEDAADARAKLMTNFGFNDVPIERWVEECYNLFEQDDQGLTNRYDPALREAVQAAGAQPAPDLWPFFDAMEGLPLALIHGENSDLLSDKTVAEMRRRRPDMGYAKVPDRGHVPFLDEPEGLATLNAWLEKMQ
ncbi:Pimeloyl-ACP methyl ester carboxylesterase [Aliiroseovarius halocynthiae]|uniref:Alpha/beta hydrolase n=1 Tax=Aliiroseovarius halocynthiae TaxID=985055 RepID=A0A545SYE1_9RHOB|nr:alpha/beta hydrolase [Aliiroseovarius halocynthiae]TQV69980.1 alpha/beta hydrolase [Aliiroseovarius halocynthiae]SMR70646.1 Pimeloyl-ACP methyl ester carboxylesterase [Aliiroseovarius halocynthiae]